MITRTRNAIWWQWHLLYHRYRWLYKLRHAVLDGWRQFTEKPIPRPPAREWREFCEAFDKWAQIE